MASFSREPESSRPVPVLPMDASVDSTNVKEKPIDEDSDSGGRRHVSASVPRTKFTPRTPASERAAMQQLRQKIAFSDQSAQSSAKSTPEKRSATWQSGGAAVRPTFSHSEQLDRQMAAFAPVEAMGEDASDGASEGEITSSVSISTILSKLDTVKSYIKEAEDLHKQLQLRSSEPGISTQVNKISKLIEELRRQESSYLSVLLTIMQREDPSSLSRLQNSGNGARTKASGLSDQSDEDSSGESTSEDSDTGKEEQRVKRSDEKVDDSLSLRAEVMQDHQKKRQEEELRVLREQQALLKQLIEQQKKIKELESKRSSLTEKKQQAEVDLVEAETEGQELDSTLQGDVAREGLAKNYRNGAALTDEQYLDGMEDLERKMPDLKLKDEEQSDIPEEDRQSLLAKLAELRAKKAQVEQLISLISSFRGTTDGSDEETALDAASESQSKMEVNPLPTTVIQPAQDLASTSELVGEELTYQTPGIAELENKVRQAEEARKRLRELQDMMALLQDTSPDTSFSECSQATPQKQPKAAQPSEIQSRERIAEQHQQQAMKQRAERQELVEKMALMQKKLLGRTPPHVELPGSEDEESEGEHEHGNEPEVDVTVPETEAGIGNILDRSLVEDYQHRLAAKRQEVARLQQQRDELLATQRRLLKLQHQVAEAEIQAQFPSGVTSKQETVEARSKPKQRQVKSEVPPFLTAEMEKESMLYGELLRKTQQLRRLQAVVVGQAGKGSSHEPRSLMSSTRVLPEAWESGAFFASFSDLTAATWGGSTAQSETDSSSLPADPDDAQETLEQADPLGGSAAVEYPNEMKNLGEECPQFRVTRHTPRPKTQRRTLTPTEEPSVSAGKKMKLDHPSPSVLEATATGSSSAHAATQPGASTYSAVWPGVIFPAQTLRNTKEEATQTSASVYSTAQEPHMFVLQQQLDVTSTMCSELLHSQNILVHSVCQRLNSFDMDATIQQHLFHLHQYHEELEQYRQQLYQAYQQLNETLPSTLAEVDGGTDVLQGPEEDQADEEEPVHVKGQTCDQGPTSEIGGGTTGPEGLGLPPHQDPQPSTHPFDTGDYAGGHPYHTAHHAASFNNPEVLYQHLQQSTEESETTPHQVPSGAIPPPPPPFWSVHSPGFYFSPHYSPYGPRGPLYPTHFSSSRYTPGSIPPSPLFRQPQDVRYSPPTHRWPYPYGYPFSSGFTPQFGVDHRPFISPHLYPTHHPFDASYNPGARVMASEAAPYPPRSPSGITAASMLVQAPSSPPSAHSVNLQQNSSSNINLQPSLDSVGVMFGTNSTGSTLRVPSFHPPIFSTSAATVTTSSTGPVPSFTANSIPSASGAAACAGSSSNQLSNRAVTATSLAQKSKDAALAELKVNIATSGASALLKSSAISPAESTKAQEPADTESLSSLPLSLPEDASAQIQHTTSLPQAVPADFSVFDALRDTIYSEVATLIASNETRPHFLVELFRELQMLSTDYLRQRALYSVQDLVTRYLTEEGVAQEAKATASMQQSQTWAGSASEHTPSQSIVTTDDEAVCPNPQNASIASSGMGFDYVEPVESGSSLATPPSSIPDDPFASESLGDTVIRLDRAMAKMRASYTSGASPKMKPPVVSPGPPEVEPISESSQSDVMQYSDLDTQLLDEQIKSIMTKVIPVLKEHLHSECTVDLLDHIRQQLMSLVIQQEKEQQQEMFDVFAKQLDATLNATLTKYLNKKLKDCGEDLLVDVSEVLFNELAFFKLMQDIRMNPQRQDFRSITSGSHTTTENEDEEAHPSTVHPPKMIVEAPLPSKPNMDPTVIQALGAAVSQTLLEEEEALGKSRDDELATMWDSKIQGQHSSRSTDEDQSLKFELSLSEMKPNVSAGSGEEDEGVANSLQPQGGGKTGQSTECEQSTLGDSKEPTPVPAEEAPKGSTTTTTKDSSLQHTCTSEDLSDGALASADPPSSNLISLETCETNALEQSVEEAENGTTTAQPLPDEEKTGDGGEATTVLAAVASIGVPQRNGGGNLPINLATANQVEVQVKVEQQTNGSLSGILASIEQGQEIAGDENELPEPVTAEP